MRRLASHYIYWQRWYHLHYVELDAEGCLVGVFPLEHEIASTEFYDGALIIVPSIDGGLPSEVFGPQWLKASDRVGVSSPVRVYLLTGITPATAELGTYHSSGDCHVKRL